MPGPVPNRESQRRRRNKEGGVVTNAPAFRSDPLDPDPEWHGAALQWYKALAVSGQAAYYEASDWATAYYVATAMSKNLEQGKFSAMLFASVMSAMSNLLVTEGDRRRARVELTHALEADPDELDAVAEFERIVAGFPAVPNGDAAKRTA